jgi:hypothetical protein
MKEKMSDERRAKVLFSVMVAAMFATLAFATVGTTAEGADSIVAKNFGGSGSDVFYSVTATTDGFYVAVGQSEPTSFQNGDWTGVDGRGQTDAIIVKYNSAGGVVWKKNFGGSNPGGDIFRSVTATSDGGVVAVGMSRIGVLGGNGDWEGVFGKGGNEATIVKFDKDGNVVWKTCFGGLSNDDFYGVTATSDGGFAAVGQAYEESFEDGDWSTIKGKGQIDAIIVFFDKDGKLVGMNNFGGSGYDRFESVTTASDGGLVAVGYSMPPSLGSGDWDSTEGKGGWDAIAVKFDKDGKVEWKKNFGGAGDDKFISVTLADDGGFVAVGDSAASSFGNGDWDTATGRGSQDGIIVKYDSAGGVVWKKNFGGSMMDNFHSVIAVDEGNFLVVGYATSFTSDPGDWAGITWYSTYDAAAVMFDKDGKPVWKRVFGGNGLDYFRSAAAVGKDSFIAVGDSASNSFGNNDWKDTPGKGGDDATLMKFGAPGNGGGNGGGGNGGGGGDSGTDNTMMYAAAAAVAIIAALGAAYFFFIRKP